MHFFSPANVMKLLEVVRGEKTGQGRAGHRDGAGQEDQEDRRRLRRCDGFIGNRMIEQYCAPGRLPAGGGRHAAAGGQGDREVRLRDGPVPHGRPGRQRHRLGHPQAPLRREARDRATARPPTCCARWAASARRPAPAGTTTSPASATRFPIPVVDELIDEAPQGARHHAAQDQRRRDRRSAASTRWSTKARRSSRRASRSAPRDIDMVYLTGYGFPLHRGGPMLYADTVGLYNVVQRDEALRRRTRTTTPLLEAGAAARQARRRRQDLQLSARSTRRLDHDRRRHRLHRPHAARQELEGRLQHDPRRHAGRPRRSRPRSSAPASTPAEVEDVIMGCAKPEGATGGNIARQIALRAGLPVTVSGVTVNRFCSSRPADHRDGRAAHHRRRGRRLSSPAASRPSRACRTRSTRTCCADPAAGENKPEIYWTMLQTAETGGQALQHPARAHGRVRRAQPADGLPPRRRPASSTTRSCRSP